MRQYIIAISCCSLPLLSYSQQNTVSSGGTANGTNGSATYTIGQIDYSNASGTDGSTNEGVQQPFEFFDPDVGLTELQWGTTLFPNPSMDQVVLQFEVKPENAQYHLYDLNGKIVLEGEILSEKTVLDVRSFAPGNYVLELTAPLKTKSTIQLIKH